MGDASLRMLSVFALQWAEVRLFLSSPLTRLALENVFDEVITVDVMDSGDRLHLALLGRPELGITFTKIHCWTLTQYSKCVFLDADTLVSLLNRHCTT